MLPKKQREIHDAFYDTARYNKVLDPKTTLMIHIASAMAVGCSP